MKLVLIDTPAYPRNRKTYEPGDCWYARQSPLGWHLWADNDHVLEEGEIAPKHAGRRPMIVCLPTGATMTLTGRAWRDGEPYGDGWDIVGELPNITVHPSINYDEGGRFAFHGFIRNGEMS